LKSGDETPSWGKRGGTIRIRLGREKTPGWGAGRGWGIRAGKGRMGEDLRPIRGEVWG